MLNDNLNLYRQLVQELLNQRAKLRSPSNPVQSETVFDTDKDRYLLVNVGWRNSTRIYGCILHVDMKNGTILGTV